MFTPLQALQKMVRQLQKLPYLASKNVYKVAIHLLALSDQEAELFMNALTEMRKKVRSCTVCFNFVEQESLCDLCTSSKRTKEIICVVESWLDLSALEKAGDYNGLYHVLGGVLSPLEGIGPESLRIKELSSRLTNGVKEVIIALNPTPEGEATASYLMTHAIAQGIVVSKLARGMPIGSSLEYMDRVTICKALAERRPC